MNIRSRSVASCQSTTSSDLFAVASWCVGETSRRATSETQPVAQNICWRPPYNRRPDSSVSAGVQSATVAAQTAHNANRPAMFVGSSTEGLAVARAVRELLHED